MCEISERARQAAEKAVPCVASALPESISRQLKVDKVAVIIAAEWEAGYKNGYSDAAERTESLTETCVELCDALQAVLPCVHDACNERGKHTAECDAASAAILRARQVLAPPGAAHRLAGTTED